jgi:hypothetical protein
MDGTSDTTMAAEIDRFAIAKELFPNQPGGFPLEDFDLKDLVLPADDDFGLKSEDDEADEDDVETESGFGSVIGRYSRRTRAATAKCAASADSCPLYPCCCSGGQPASCAPGEV